MTEAPVREKTKQKTFLGINVLEAAKLRLHQIFDSFDHVCVQFSGGKDSLVLLHLTREVQLERGDSSPTHCVFRDEELIPDDVIEFVQGYRRDTANWRMDYYAVPLRSTKFILGETFDYVQWDPARRWIRPKPDGAITQVTGFAPDQVFSQYDMDEAAFASERGRVASMIGIRADESQQRFHAIVSKRHEPHIASPHSRIVLCRPIYDWSQNDIFRYLYDRKIPYCQIYDNQVWNKQPLRVATLFRHDGAKRLHKFKTLYSVFYEQLIDVFPEMLVQSMYWDDLDRYGIIDKYEPSWTGIIKYIDDNISEPAQNSLAKSRVNGAQKRRAKKPNDDNFGGYPILYVFQSIINGHYKRDIQPLKTPSPRMIEYENKFAELRKKRLATFSELVAS